MKTYYSEETKRATINFPFSYKPVAKELIFAIVAIKKAAARANRKDHGISEEKAVAIEHACDAILAGKYDDQFVTCALQGGAGTSMHMNVNEVVAALAMEYIAKKGNKTVVHPLDDVNKSQSTNDVNPSALKIACYRLVTLLEETLKEAGNVVDQKAHQWATVAKLARTHLQDAIPTTVGAEFASYSAILKRHTKRFRTMKPFLLELNLGGTAIGNSLNASAVYRKVVYRELADITSIPVVPLDNLMSGTSSQTDFVALSQTIVSLYVDLSKIASDIRLLVSGPNGGISELHLPKLQNGSTIMPGKVNPVSAEIVNQTYYLLSGYEATIEQAAHASQLELGVMFPILADTMIQSLILAREVLAVFTAKCLSVLEVDKERCYELLVHSTAYATILTPLLGYDVVSGVVRDSLAEKKTIIAVLQAKGLYTEKVKALLEKPL